MTIILVNIITKTSKIQNLKIKFLNKKLTEQKIKIMQKIVIQAKTNQIFLI